MIQVEAGQEQVALSKRRHKAVQPFPRDMFCLLRCNNDYGELAIVPEFQCDGAGVLDAMLRCKTCGTEFRIEDGIAPVANAP